MISKAIFPFLASLVLTVLSFGEVGIRVDATEAIDENRQTVFFTVTIDGGDYEFHGVVPAMDEAATRQYVETRKEEYAVLVLGKMYKRADWKRFRTEQNSDLEAFGEWISDGHRNIIRRTEGDNQINEYTIIEKVPFRSTHPEWLKLEKEIDGLNSMAKMRAFLKKIIRRIK